jgi:hypothetical protein
MGIPASWADVSSVSSFSALGSSGSGLTNILQHHIKFSTIIFAFSFGWPGRTSNEFPACRNT